MCDGRNPLFSRDFLSWDDVGRGSYGENWRIFCGLWAEFEFMPRNGGIIGDFKK